MTGLELFIKVGIYTTAILLPIAILVLLCILFFKYGVGSIIQTIVDKLDYIVDKITEDIRGVFDFCRTEFIRILVVIFDHSTNMVLLGLLYVINNAVVVQHADSSIVSVLCLCIFGCTITVFKKGDGMEKYFDSIVSFFKKDNKEIKDKEENKNS